MNFFTDDDQYMIDSRNSFSSTDDFQFHYSIDSFDLSSASSKLMSFPSPLDNDFNENLTFDPLEDLATISHKRSATSPIRIVSRPQITNDLVHHYQTAHYHPLPPSKRPKVQEITQNDIEFQQVCDNDTIIINPKMLGFIPKAKWTCESITFGRLFTDFFQKKNNSNSRFSHKLFNALLIANAHPDLIPCLGIYWLTDTVLRVDKKAFARLLGIKTIDGSLFHQQGNFPSHGFIELNERDVLNYLTPSQVYGVDYDNVRLLVHQGGVFVKNVSEKDIECCKWINSRKHV